MFIVICVARDLFIGPFLTRWEAEKFLDETTGGLNGCSRDNPHRIVELEGEETVRDWMKQS